MYQWASTTWHYFNIDNELQPLLTLLSLLAAVMQLNSTFYHHATTAYMHGRKDISQRTVTVPMFSSTISPTLIGTTFSTELWSQKNGKKTFKCWSRSAWTKNCVSMWVKQQHCGRLWIFSHRWPGCCIKDTLLTRKDSRKTPMGLDYPDKLFLSSSDKFLRLSSSSCSQINDT